MSNPRSLKVIWLAFAKPLTEDNFLISTLRIIILITIILILSTHSLDEYIITSSCYIVYEHLCHSHLHSRRNFRGSLFANGLVARRYHIISMKPYRAIMDKKRKNLMESKFQEKGDYFVIPLLFFATRCNLHLPGKKQQDTSVTFYTKVDRGVCILCLLVHFRGQLGRFDGHL